MRAGTALTQLVEFADGFPDANISWSLLDGAGAEVANGSVVPVADSVSAIITVTGAENTLGAGELYGSRELNWSYAVAGIIRSGTVRYQLEAFLPLGVSPEGVRRKLGVEPHEVEDDTIDLVGAYSRFQDTIGEANLTAVVAAGGLEALVARDGIEALAALMLIPSLQIRLAAKQSSGTDQFQRASIKWDELRAQLNDLVAQAYTAVDPTFDETAELGALLVTVVRSDPIVGEAQ
jgi:hypothetical protein